MELPGSHNSRSPILMGILEILLMKQKRIPC